MMACQKGKVRRNPNPNNIRPDKLNNIPIITAMKIVVKSFLRPEMVNFIP